MPGVPRGVDWTPMWHKELSVNAAYAYGPERTVNGIRDTFELAIEHIAPIADRLARLVGPAFPLEEYRAAFRSALRTGESKIAKTVFALRT